MFDKSSPPSRFFPSGRDSTILPAGRRSVGYSPTNSTATANEGDQKTLGAIGTGRPNGKNDNQLAVTRNPASIQARSPISQTVGFMSGSGMHMAPSREQSLHNLNNFENNNTGKEQARTHRRRLTPTEEELNSSLIKMGLDANSGNSEILDTTRRQLGMNGFKQVVNGGINGTFQQGPVNGANRFSNNNGISMGLGIENKNPKLTLPQCYTPTPRPISSSTTHSEDRFWSGNQLAPSRDGSENNRENNKTDWFTGKPLFKRPGFTGPGQIDPYIPESSVTKTPSMNYGNSYLPWNQNLHKTPDLGTGSDLNPFPATPSTNGTSNTESNLWAGQNNDLTIMNNNTSDQHAMQNYPQSPYGILTPPHTKDEYLENARVIENLNKSLWEAKQQANFFKTQYENACQIGLRHIAIREAEIANLKRQLRFAGIKPFDEQTPRYDDSYWSNELGMMLRMLCCWSKRFYKFPTMEVVPDDLHRGLLELCEDPHNLNFLMNSQDAKCLVVASLACRLIVHRIFKPEFLDKIANELLQYTESGPVLGSGVAGVLELAKSKEGYEDKLFDAMHQGAAKLAFEFLRWIHPLMSRPKDNSHHEQTKKQFVQVAQHAVRIALAAIKQNSVIEFHFFHHCEKFRGETMREVTADNIGLDSAINTTGPLRREIQGALIRMCVLPSAKVTIVSTDGTTREVEAYKANVLLLEP